MLLFKKKIDFTIILNTILIEICYFSDSKIKVGGLDDALMQTNKKSFLPISGSHSAKSDCNALIFAITILLKMYHVI